MKVTEAQFQRTVIAAAQYFGWKVAHFRPGMSSKRKWMTAVAGNGAGFPDLVLVHPKRHGSVLFVELKSNTGKMSPSQMEWYDWIHGAGANSLVWRPKDWMKIENVLRTHETRDWHASTTQA